MNPLIFGKHVFIDYTSVFKQLMAQWRQLTLYNEQRLWPQENSICTEWINELQITFAGQFTLTFGRIMSRYKRTEQIAWYRHSGCYWWSLLILTETFSQCVSFHYDPVDNYMRIISRNALMIVISYKFIKLWRTSDFLFIDTNKGAAYCLR